MMISSAEHRDVSVVCQTQASWNVGQLKSEPLRGSFCFSPVAPPIPCGPAKECLIVESTGLKHSFETMTSLSFYFALASIKLNKIVSQATC